MLYFFSAVRKMKPKKVIKVRKKHWYTIIAPKLFNNLVIGESYVYDQRELLGRYVTVNLMNLTHDPKTQHINIGFKINELKGDKVATEIVKFSVINSAIKRLVRRGSTRIDETLICETADHKNLKVKVFLVTKVHVQSSKASKLRKLLADFAIESVKKQTYEQFTEELVAFKFKREMKAVLNKLYPLRACEIRSVTFATEKDVSKRRAKPKKTEEIKPKEESDSAEIKIPEALAEEKKE